jgi:hypothetical protein
MASVEVEPFRAEFDRNVQKLALMVRPGLEKLKWLQLFELESVAHV